MIIQFDFDITFLKSITEIIIFIIIIKQLIKKNKYGNSIRQFW